VNSLIVARKTPQHIPEHYLSPQKKSLPRHKRQSKEHIIFCLMLVLVLAAVVLLITQYSQTVFASYRINKLERKIQLLNEEQNRLEVEVAKLGSLERIERVAVEELGLQYPDLNQLRLLEARRY
jgi:cell division protein FtsL